MRLNSRAAVYVPDGKPEDEALARCTHLAVSAHQDDIEFMAYAPIAECFGRSDKWFAGVVVTDGAGSPRNGLYGNYTDEDMKAVRIREQEKAAHVGEYAAQILLAHSSSQARDPGDEEIAEELKQILLASKPRFVYIHNLADKHDTHVGTALKCIRALRSLKPEDRPEKVYGCEVWRSLDWMCDDEKIVLDCSAHPNIGRCMSALFDSQIAGGKRYDLAAEGRRAANATFFQSHACDDAEAVNFAMDLTPLVEDAGMDMAAYVKGYMDRFEQDVLSRLARYGKQ